MAERGRFELPVRYKPTHAFQACALNHSAISPASGCNLKKEIRARNTSDGSSTCPKTGSLVENPKAEGPKSEREGRIPKTEKLGFQNDSELGNGVLSWIWISLEVVVDNRGSAAFEPLQQTKFNRSESVICFDRGNRSFVNCLEGNV